MRRAFEAYQYVAPALLTPLAAWLWWRASLHFVLERPDGAR